MITEGISLSNFYLLVDKYRWETKTRAEVEAEYPDEYKSWDADPFTCKSFNLNKFSVAPTGGESGLQVLARALPALRNIIEKHEGELFDIFK